MRGWVRRAVTGNLTLKLVSLALAVLLFVVVHSEKLATVHGSLNVVYVVPPGKVLATRPPATLRIAVSGPLSRTQRFRLDDLGPIEIDLSNAREGTFKFRDDLVAVPTGLKLAFIRPDGFNLRFEPTYRKVLPVHLAIGGEPPSGYRIIGRSVRPSRVAVSGPRRLVAALAMLRTEPLSLEGSEQTVREKVMVLVPPGIQTVEPDSVEATVTIGPVLTEAVLKSVRVVVEDPARRNVEPSPAEVAVRLEAPAIVLSALKPARLTARVTVAARQTGVLELKPSIQGLPAGVKVVRVVPPTVALRLGASRRIERGRAGAAP